MGHPVTTNPFIIMLINMTVVFIVLVSLGFIIHLIHVIDPTKPKEEENSAEESSVDSETAAIISKLKESPQTSEPVKETPQGISEEVIAAISAAIACCGISGQVKAVRILNHENTAWKQSGIIRGISKK